MKGYENIFETSDTVSATFTKPYTYVNKLIEHVRNTPLEEDARNNAEIIVREEVSKIGRQVGEKFGNYIAIILFLVFLEHFIYFYF